MSKIRHTLQLLHSGQLSQRQIGVALGISKSTVSEIASYTRAAGLDWAQALQLTDQELQARLYRPAVARQSRHLEPDYAHLHSELKRAGVTLQLLWEEYQKQHQGAAYKYSAFCEKYQQWAKRLKRSMRQTHEAGDKLFVDYAGQTVPIVDSSTGEITQAQIFVAVLGASN
jgi:transposase